MLKINLTQDAKEDLRKCYFSQKLYDLCYIGLPHVIYRCSDMEYWYFYTICRKRTFVNWVPKSLEN